MTKDEALNIAIDYMNERLEQHDAKFQRHPVAEAERNNILADIKAVKEALAQPEHEPVTWRYKIVDVFGRPVWTLKTPKSDTRVLESQPLYTTPPQRKPLTDEEITDAVQDAGLDWHYAWTLNDEESSRLTKFARAIEEAHGIKGEA